MDRRSRYAAASIDVRDKSANSVRKDAGPQQARTVLRLFNLVQIVPNWETYLTEKQLEAVVLYKGNRDLNKCDEILELSKGGTYTRIFGDKYNQHHGAVGRLEAAYKKLFEAGVIS